MNRCEKLISAIGNKADGMLISSEVNEESIILAVEAPIPETPISSLNNSLSSFVAKP